VYAVLALGLIVFFIQLKLNLESGRMVKRLTGTNPTDIEKRPVSKLSKRKYTNNSQSFRKHKKQSIAQNVPGKKKGSKHVKKGSKPTSSSTPKRKPYDTPSTWLVQIPTVSESAEFLPSSPITGTKLNRLVKNVRKKITQNKFRIERVRANLPLKLQNLKLNSTMVDYQNLLRHMNNRLSGYLSYLDSYERSIIRLIEESKFRWRKVESRKTGVLLMDLLVHWTLRKSHSWNSTVLRLIANRAAAWAASNSKCESSPLIKKTTCKVSAPRQNIIAQLTNFVAHSTRVSRVNLTSNFKKLRKYPPPLQSKRNQESRRVEHIRTSILRHISWIHRRQSSIQSWARTISHELISSDSVPVEMLNKHKELSKTYEHSSLGGALDAIQQGKFLFQFGIFQELGQVFRSISNGKYLQSKSNLRRLLLRRSYLWKILRNLELAAIRAVKIVKQTLLIRRKRLLLLPIDIISSKSIPWTSNQKINIAANGVITSIELNAKALQLAQIQYFALINRSRCKSLRMVLQKTNALILKNKLISSRFPMKNSKIIMGKAQNILLLMELRWRIRVLGMFKQLYQMENKKLLFKIKLSLESRKELLQKMKHAKAGLPASGDPGLKKEVKRLHRRLASLATERSNLPNWIRLNLREALFSTIDTSRISKLILHLRKHVAKQLRNFIQATRWEHFIQLHRSKSLAQRGRPNKVAIARARRKLDNIDQILRTLMCDVMNQLERRLDRVRNNHYKIQMYTYWWMWAKDSTLFPSETCGMAIVDISSLPIWGIYFILVIPWAIRSGLRPVAFRKYSPERNRSRNHQWRKETVHCKRRRIAERELKWYKGPKLRKFIQTRQLMRWKMRWLRPRPLLFTYHTTNPFNMHSSNLMVP
jgi:hypothetical protein